MCRSLFSDVLKKEMSSQGVKIFKMNVLMTAHNDLYLKLKNLPQFEDQTFRFSEESADEM